MEIKQGISVDYFIINDLERLDPIIVVIKDDNRKGKVIVECFGESWSTYFGSIGDRTLNDFISSLDMCYLANRLISNTFHNPTRLEAIYVNRIAQAVIDACKLRKGE